MLGDAQYHFLFSVCCKLAEYGKWEGEHGGKKGADRRRASDKEEAQGEGRSQGKLPSLPAGEWVSPSPTP